MKKTAILIIGIITYLSIIVMIVSLVMIGCTADEAIYVTSDVEFTTATKFVDENGNTYGIKQVDNRLRISSMPFAFDVATGQFPDKFSINKFGHNPNVAVSLETIWTGSNLYPYMTTADQFEVLSNNVLDDIDGGTGAWTIELFGLDADFDMINEIVSMNGTAPSLSSLTYLRIYRAVIRTAGVLGWNAGIITVRDQDTDTTRAIIEANINQTLMALFPIPAGYTGYITSWYAGSSLNKDTHVEMFVRPFGEVFQVKRHIHLFRQSYVNRFDFPEVVPEKSDIELRAQAAGGGGEISGGFFLWLEEN